MNGHKTDRLRMVLSAMITVVCVASATGMVLTDHSIPDLFWAVIVLATAGVAGGEVASIVLRKDHGDGKGT